MITCQEKALEQMRLGLFDVLPSGSLDALTAEDFRLLLNGVSLKYIVLSLKRGTHVHANYIFLQDSPYMCNVNSS